MARRESKRVKKLTPALTIEERENRIISAAMDLAEKQILEGTASSQVITHYLRLGSTKERLERELLEEKTELLRAKTDAIEAAKRSEELYAQVLEAMKLYSGHGDGDDYE